MKLLITIIQDDDSSRLVSAMTKSGFSVTKLATTGGFLRAGNTTLLIGVNEEKLDQCLNIIENTCKSRKQIVNASMGGYDLAMNMAHNSIEVTVGGATVFILSVDEFKKY